MVKTHIVVDGSNLATEGRTAPSLEQLDEAVTAFIGEHPDSEVTVVVDATFGHRIVESEKAEYEEAILAGELVTPPAGAVGRGDAFVLQIADKASATVLSNDSFQEFHGTYDWLFDDGRLIGGKPVRNVGWVFVMRTPVRGPTSRRATRAVRTGKATTSTSSRATADGEASSGASTGASRPGRKRATRAKKSSGRAAPAAPADSAAVVTTPPSSSKKGRRRRGGSTASEPINELGPFLAFVEAHPVGSVANGTVDRFSSHGAYAVVDGALCYVPLKSMGDPPPAKAREVLALGEVRPFEVTSFDSQRRGIDVALAEPGAAPIAVDAAFTGPGTELPHQPTAQEAAPTMATAKKKAPATTAAAQELAKVEKAVRKTVAAAKKKVVGVDKAAKRKATTAGKKASAKKTSVKRSTAAKKAAAKRTSAQRSTAAKKGAAKRPSVKRSTAAKKGAAKRTSAQRSTAAKKGAAKRTSAKKAPAKKSAAKKSTAKRSTAKKAPAKRSTAKKSTAKKSTARKTTARKAPAKRAAKKA
jgi:hypothetical protein